MGDQLEITIVIDLDLVDLNGLVQGKFNRKLGYLTPSEKLRRRASKLSRRRFSGRFGFDQDRNLVRFRCIG